MTFEPLKGMKGKVFVPEFSRGEKRKHQCRDCFHCQNCSDDRCTVCLMKCDKVSSKGQCHAPHAAYLLKNGK